MDATCPKKVVIWITRGSSGGSYHWVPTRVRGAGLEDGLRAAT
jgi:hypothetical protein